MVPNVLVRIFYCLWTLCLNLTWNQKSRCNISKTCSQKQEKLSPLKHFIWYQTLIKTLKRKISEAYKLRLDCFKDSESDSYDRNDMKEKVNELVRLHEAMQEKLQTASYSEQIQILTLVSDKWSWLYWSEYFIVFEYLVWNWHEIKKVGGILAKPAPKNRKNYHHWNTSSPNKRLWSWPFQ